MIIKHVIRERMPGKQNNKNTRQIIVGEWDLDEMNQ
jgi:hypothetical protein